MKTFLTLSIILFCAVLGFAQGRLILNNNAFINITNGGKIVLANSNANAITEVGTASQIISEGETNEVIWRIGNNTGVYTIPWGTTPTVLGGNGTKIPFTINVTTGGTIANSNAGFRFSSYETTDMNTPWHSRVDHMIGANTGTDNSLFVADRFWQLDGTDYTTRPSATLSFTYDDAANEIAVTNTLTEANLRAQRWNDVAGGWETLLFGSNDAATNTVSAVDFQAAGNHEVWVLTDLTSPLPVELGDFTGISASCENYLSWITHTERNNDYFNLQRSFDLVNWETIGQVNGAGNSTSELEYEFIDNDVTTNGIVYYRLEQVDFDGTTDLSKIISVNQNCSDSNEPNVFPNPFDNHISIFSTLPFDAQLMDTKGKIIRVLENMPEGKTVISTEGLTTGVYLLRTINKLDESFTFKLLRK